MSVLPVASEQRTPGFTDIEGKARPARCRMTRVFIPLVPLAYLLAAGCQNDDSTGVVCTAELTPGVAVEVVSAEDMSPVVQGLTGILIDGRYTELLTAPGNRLLGAYERPGTYSVIISANGFHKSQVDSIKVEADECHVITEEVRVELSPVG